MKVKKLSKFSLKNLVLVQLFVARRSQTKSQILLWILEKISKFKSHSDTEYVLYAIQRKKQNIDNMHGKLLSTSQIWVLLACHI